MFTDKPRTITVTQSTFFVGLMHGTLSDNTGGKFAAVVPSTFVTPTLEAASRKAK
jgi:hypothetical protein